MKDETKNISIVVILLMFVLGMIVVSMFDSNINERISSDKIKSFSSYSELKEFLEESQSENSGILNGVLPAVNRQFAQEDSASVTAEGSGAKTGDYSKTNIQVEGVDEADIVKNDGKYIYDIVGNKVVIVNAFPAEGMKIVSEIEFKDESLLGIFVNEDKLVVFAQGYETINSGQGVEGSVVHNVEGVENAKIASEAVATGMIAPSYYGGESKIYTYIYDISDRARPELDDEISVEGNYINSRMIGDYVYVIGSKYVNGNDPVMPMLKVNGVEERMAISDLYYFDYWDYEYAFNTISAVNIDNGEVDNKVYLTGSSNNIYVSEDNIYLTYTKFLDQRDYFEDMIKEVVLPIVPSNEGNEIRGILSSDESFFEKSNEINKIVSDYSSSLEGRDKDDFDQKLYNGMNEFVQELREEREKTVIHKIGVDEEEIEYITEGEVKGSVLNQFSMDENEGYFRIATTSGESWNGNSKNNIYVLNENLNLVGEIENLAPGERIYSARFIEDRVYLVTFRQIDPFYVIDLSEANEPKVLGYLKIPGYSDYLHAYDENHIIGIGKETVEISNNGRDFVSPQGLKIAIFDVRDVANPKESAKIVIGDKGTDSNALYDHKAFLFDKSRNLMVLPINLAKIKENQYNSENPQWAYGEVVWQGAYIFDIKENEIKVKGQVTHFDDIKKYGSASEEPIGAKREGHSGEIWTKVAEDKWETDRVGLYEQDSDIATRSYYGYYENIWSNEMIDSLPGGINNNPFYDYKYQVQRSLYIGDNLYTLSPAKIKANSLVDNKEISEIELPFEENYYGGILY